MHKYFLIDTNPIFGSANNFYDGVLTIKFDNADLELIRGFFVRIMDAETDTLVDEICIENEIDNIGKHHNNVFRSIKRNLIYFNDCNLVIKPHDGILKPLKYYYILIEEGSIVNGYIAGKTFSGISKKNEWSFSTKTSVQCNRLIVGNTQDSHFKTVQGALNHLMKYKYNSSSIFIRNGVYHEVIYVHGLMNLTITGESRQGVYIHCVNSEKVNEGSGKSSNNLDDRAQGGRALFMVEDCDLIRIENLTMSNEHIRTGQNDQAEVLYFKARSQDRMILDSVNLLSEQDTIQVSGFCFIYNCLIAGNVDFIWGYNNTTLFEECEIRTVGDSKYCNGSAVGGYIVQARTISEENVGFVFLKCRLTNSKGPKGVKVLENSTFLARSGGHIKYFDIVTFINTSMDRHIHSSGWADENQGHPNPNGNRWKEYGSTDLYGNVLNLSFRSKNGNILNEADITGNYDNRQSVFKMFNNNKGWYPIVNSLN